MSLCHTLFAVLLPLFLRNGNMVQAELIEKHLFTITVYSGWVSSAWISGILNVDKHFFFLIFKFSVYLIQNFPFKIEFCAP